MGSGPCFVRNDPAANAFGPDAAQFTFAPLDRPGIGRSSWLIGAAVDEHSRDLGYAAEDILAAMVADGTMAAIFATYGLTYDPPEAHS
jgi:hypothetical protein